MRDQSMTGGGLPNKRRTCANRGDHDGWPVRIRTVARGIFGVEVRVTVG